MSDLHITIPGVVARDAIWLMGFGAALLGGPMALLHMLSDPARPRWALACALACAAGIFLMTR